jgi:hypothetical protein
VRFVQYKTTKDYVFGMWELRHSSNDSNHNGKGGGALGTAENTQHGARYGKGNGVELGITCAVGEAKKFKAGESCGIASPINKSGFTLDSVTRFVW